MSRPDRRGGLDLAVLAALGAGIVAVSALLAAELPQSRAGHFGYHGSLVLLIVGSLALYGASAAWIWRRRLDGRYAIGIVVVVAVAARLVLAVHPPVISHDVYRYVWDGRVEAHGINPYRYTPNDPALARLRDAVIWGHVDRRSVRTIYPPAAQGVFRLSSLVDRGSVTGIRVVFTLLDGVSILLLAGLLARFGLRPERALLYGWHPLAILEIGQSGHVDAVAIPLLLLAMWAFFARRTVAPGVLLGLAVLVKPYALIALPVLLLLRRPRDAVRTTLTLLATTALAYLPFLGPGRHVAGYLFGYAREEGIVSGHRFYLLRELERLIGASIGAAWYVPFAAAVGLALLAGLRSRRLRTERAVASGILLLFVVALVLTSPAYPWYSLIALALAPLARGAVLVPASFLGASAGLLYYHLEVPSHPGWPPHVVYGGTGLLLVGAAGWVLLGSWLATRASQSAVAQTSAG